MAHVTISFPTDVLQTSIKVGDTVYYIKDSNMSSQGGFKANSSWLNSSEQALADSSVVNDVIKLGDVAFIPKSNTIIVDVQLNVALPTSNDYIFVSRNNEVQQSSVVGYFASVKFENTSCRFAEMFQTSIGAMESSK